ncbi:MAG: hypothetical protein NTX61_10140 [Bacteroidetes bacterium]|nr:hypothetical protein [Bacteroidota bacterium]
MKRLMGQQQELEEKLRISNNEIAEFIQINSQQKTKINQLEEKIRILRLTKTIEKKEGASEAKSKINELVREIDKCMGLLNT